MPTASYSKDKPESRKFFVATENSLLRELILVFLVARREWFGAPVMP